MAKEELIEMNGVVDEILPDSRYRVTLELSPYDINNGRITFRHIESKTPYTPPKRRTY